MASPDFVLSSQAVPGGGPVYMSLVTCLKSVMTKSIVTRVPKLRGCFKARGIN